MKLEMDNIKKIIKQIRIHTHTHTQAHIPAKRNKKKKSLLYQLNHITNFYPNILKAEVIH